MESKIEQSEEQATAGQPQDVPPVASKQAIAAMKSAGAWLSSVGVRAKEAAVVAGHQLDKAAITVGMKVDEFSSRATDVYDERASRNLALSGEQRNMHRFNQETAFTAEHLEQLKDHGDGLLAECLTLAGDVQQEMQYATTESPLGRESYGLMMLVNILVPALEHGVRPDWKGVLPPAAFLQGGPWTNNLMVHMRSHAPSAFAMLLAAERGWKNQPTANIGAVEVEEMGQVSTHEHKLQAWLFTSLNTSLLAQRLTLLMSLSTLQEDWLFPWAVLRRPGAMDQLLTEIVKIESLPGYIHVPLSELHTPRATSLRLSGWSDKMIHSFSKASDIATLAGQKAYNKGAQVGHKVSDAVKAVRDFKSDGGSTPGGGRSPDMSPHSGGDPSASPTPALDKMFNSEEQSTPSPNAPGRYTDESKEAVAALDAMEPVPIAHNAPDGVATSLKSDDGVPELWTTVSADPGTTDGLTRAPSFPDAIDVDGVVLEEDDRFGLDDDEDEEFFATTSMPQNLPDDVLSDVLGGISCVSLDGDSSGEVPQGGHGTVGPKME